MPAKRPLSWQSDEQIIILVVRDQRLGLYPRCHLYLARRTIVLRNALQSYVTSHKIVHRLTAILPKSTQLCSVAIGRRSVLRGTFVDCSHCSAAWAVPRRYSTRDATCVNKQTSGRPECAENTARQERPVPVACCCASFRTAAWCWNFPGEVASHALVCPIPRRLVTSQAGQTTDDATDTAARHGSRM